MGVEPSVSAIRTQRITVFLVPEDFDTRTIGVAGENRTLVDWFTASRLHHSATATSGARNTSRTCLSSFSDWRLDRDGLPGEPGGRGGNRTLICWVQASRPPVGRLPRKLLAPGVFRCAYACGAPRLSYSGACLFFDGASAENRTPFTGLAIRCPANRPHSPARAAGVSSPVVCGGAGTKSGAQQMPALRFSSKIFSCQRPRLRFQQAHFKPPASTKKQARQSLSFPINAKRAAIFGGRPFLKPEFIPRRSGHLTRVMIDAPQRTLQFGAELESVCHAV